MACPCGFGLHPLRTRDARFTFPGSSAARGPVLTFTTRSWRDPGRSPSSPSPRGGCGQARSRLPRALGSGTFRLEHHLSFTTSAHLLDSGLDWDQPEGRARSRLSSTADSARPALHSPGLLHKQANKNKPNKQNASAWRCSAESKRCFSNIRRPPGPEPPLSASFLSPSSSARPSVGFSLSSALCLRFSLGPSESAGPGEAPCSEAPLKSLGSPYTVTFVPKAPSLRTFFPVSSSTRASPPMPRPVL